MSAPQQVYTKWGWVSGRALWRLKEGYKAAIKDSQHGFEIDGRPYLTRFAGYLIEFLEDEGLIAIATDTPVPIFTQEQGHA